MDDARTRLLALEEHLQRRRDSRRVEASNEAVEAFVSALHLPLDHNQLVLVAERGPVDEPDVLRMLLSQPRLTGEHVVALVWSCWHRSPGDASSAKRILARRQDLLTRAAVLLAGVLPPTREDLHAEVSLRLALDGVETFEVFESLLADRPEGDLLSTLSMAEVLTIPDAEDLHDDLV